jgi:hypothetical protein
MAEADRFDLRELAQRAELACERIRRGVGVIARIYEAGEDGDGWRDDVGLVSLRAVSVALAELGAEIPELRPREAAFGIARLHDENDRARGVSDDRDWNAAFLDKLDIALADQQSDHTEKVRLFGLMKARHDPR